MHRILQSAGAPEKALSKIQQVIDTCRTCRPWQKPSPISAATARLIEAFNELVQHDLMFVSPKPGDPETPRAQPWQHVLDTATRLAQAAIIQHKAPDELIASFDTIWVRPYGAPTTLESDPESGIVADETKVYFDRIGTKCKIKGVGAHVQMAEKHQDLLRQTFLRTWSQAQREGLPITNDHCLTVSLTAKNSLFTVGDMSPMQAVFGRQPAVLPNLDAPATTLDDTHTGPELLSRGRHRMKEIANQSMIEATARKRMEIAASSKPRQAVQGSGFNVGDEVEFHRKIQGKEVSGWRGPGEIMKLDSDGTVHVKWQGSGITCRLQDVRQALVHLIFFLCYQSSRASGEISAWEFVQNFVSRMPIGTQQIIGIIAQAGRRRVSRASEDQPQLLIAVLRAAACELHIGNCIGARLVRGQHRLSGITGYIDSLLVMWRFRDQESICHLRSLNV